MLIKDLIREGLTIPENPLYSSEPWFVFAKPYLTMIMQRFYGRREILDSIADDAATTADIIADVRATIMPLFAINTWKYKHLYNLYAAEYNPIWNVDGTEKTITHRKTVGTKDATDSKSGDDTLEYLGEETFGKGGTETITFDGTETHEKKGSVFTKGNGDNQEAKTTFDSDTDYDTVKNTTNDSGVTTYGKTDLATDPLQDITSFSDRENETTYNTTDTRSFDKRKDKTTYDSKNTLDEDTTENYDETVEHIRTGNIGVTQTQAMASAELDLAGRFKFLDIIAHDIVNVIAYS